jgi:hypothetical protein
MPTASETLGNQSQLESTLDSGIASISQGEQVQFQKYTKFVLAPDSYVFWIATAQTMTISGSLHYATDRVQEEDQTIATNQVLLTSESEITQFNLVSPTEMWIGAWPTGAVPLQVAFAQRGAYYEPANVWHYSGFAVYPALSAQIVSSALDLPQGPIVSNSLPIWLAQTTFASTTVPVYPSFLVPDNIVPPYVVAHIEPSQTQALGAFPLVGPWPGTTIPDSGASPLHWLASSQLMRDEVTLTLYGFTNQMALQYFESLIEASADGVAPFGFANSPAISDAKRTQPEIAALAQKKTIQISANYYQGAAEVIARRLMLSASVSSIALAGGIVPIGQGAILQDEQSVAGTNLPGLTKPKAKRKSAK